MQDILTFPEKYELLNPNNGWGSYESALTFLKEVLQKLGIKLEDINNKI